MSYINETVSSLQDFVTKLDAFLTGTPGWTQDHLDTGAGKWAIHKTGTGISLYISFRWDTASPNVLAIYQALGFISTGTNPGNHTDDSGNGAVSSSDTTLNGQRRMPITNTPVQYWAFEDDTYVHVVVQTTSAPRFVHFGFGVLDKFADYTGGEYCYGWRHVSTTQNVGTQLATTVLLDGYCTDDAGVSVTNMEEFAATMHLEGFPNMAVGAKWCVVMGNQSAANLGNDRGGTARGHVFGGFRAGLIASPFNRFSANSLAGLVPMYPIGCCYLDRTTGDAMYLGNMKDVRGASIEYFSPGDEIIVGSDTWVIFPSMQKAADDTTISSTSGYQGIAYRKVTT